MTIIYCSYPFISIHWGLNPFVCTNHGHEPIFRCTIQESQRQSGIPHISRGVHPEISLESSEAVPEKKPLQPMVIASDPLLFSTHYQSDLHWNGFRNLQVLMTHTLISVICFQTWTAVHVTLISTIWLFNIVT